jgi:undecaprenyl pyrophosphate phosphatase UppP
MPDKEEAIRKRDDRLLRNEKSWRRARVGAIVLFIIFFAITISIVYTDNLESPLSEHQAIIAMAIWCVFWLLLIDWLTLRLRHIDSIKLYRKTISEKSGTNDNTLQR